MRVNLIAATRRVLLTAGVSGAAVAAQAYNACGPCQPAYIDCPPAMSVDTPPAPTPSGEASAAPTPGQSDGVQPLAPDASVDLSPTAPPVSSVASSNRSQASFAPNMIGDFFWGDRHCSSSARISLCQLEHSPAQASATWRWPSFDFKDNNSRAAAGPRLL